MVETPTCAFTFDPTGRTHPAGTLPDEDLNEEGEWECPHEPYEGHDRCLIHLDPDKRPPGDETAWFLNAIEASDRAGKTERRHRKQFIGGWFRELDLTSTVIDAEDNHPLDFRHTRIETLDCSEVSVTHDIDLGLAQVSGRVSMDGDFEELRGRGGQFNAVDLDDGVFERVDFRTACIDSVSLANSTVEHGDFRHAAVRAFRGSEATFERANFEFARISVFEPRYASFGMSDFNNATFGRGDFYYAEFGQSDFRGIEMDEAIFKGAELDGGYFNGATFGVSNWIGVDMGNAYFNGSTFDEASFRKSDLTSADFPNCHFGWANFQNATLSAANFQHTTFEQATFRGSEFHGEADFRDIDPAGALNLRDCDFEDLHARPAPSRAPHDGLVLLDHSDLPKATLEQPVDARAIYDLRGATVGDVTFYGDSGLLNRIRFLRTEFDGFDFRDSDDLDPKETGYAIHEMDPDAETLASRLLRYGLTLHGTRQESDGDLRPTDRTDEPAYSDLRARAWERTEPHDSGSAARPNYDDISAADLEATYLRAKNGANEMNDNEAASQFFIREMRQRRIQHADLFWGAETARDRLRYGTDWVENTTLGWTSGYGESPGRVIYTSAITVAGFAGVYYALDPDLYTSVTDYFILSIGSFVTLVVGRVGDIPDTTINLLSQVQAFLGAFLIALFVFTLTRSIHR
ncbi:pentapeptide repeat-containing protein [Natronomonas sp.]|uniref:pentapeptide repeat-containing protein n=1 Tax=Natronomonas sp. TaxID=2184060 RepID=UPI002FC312BE